MTEAFIYSPKIEVSQLYNVYHRFKDEFSQPRKLQLLINECRNGFRELIMILVFKIYTARRIEFISVDILIMNASFSRGQKPKKKWIHRFMEVHSN